MYELGNREELPMRKLVATIFSLITLAGCTDPRAATKALDDMTFKEIEITGWRLWGCGDNYTFTTGFRAKNQNGKVVTGMVCSGWLKGSSVKFD